jgi:hypothetical protein
VRQESASSYGCAPDDDAMGMMALVEELFPICRSITGNGVRQTLEIVKRYIPLKVNEVPSGTMVLDWTVPREWNIRDAYIARPDGERIVDFAVNNLHIVQYSRPIDAMIPLAELRPHLHTLPDHPDWVPYRTSYYSENWGFCLTHRQLSSLSDGLYRVVIDSELEAGYLSYGELLIPGETDDTVLFSCHVCHPSLANDNLSGIAVATILASYIQTLRRRYSYRFLFIPGTIGSLTCSPSTRTRSNASMALVFARHSIGNSRSSLSPSRQALSARFCRGILVGTRPIRRLRKSIAELQGNCTRSQLRNGRMFLGCSLDTPNGRRRYSGKAAENSNNKPKSLRFSLPYFLRQPCKLFRARYACFMNTLKLRGMGPANALVYSGLASPLTSAFPLLAVVSETP